MRPNQRRAEPVGEARLAVCAVPMVDLILAAQSALSAGLVDRWSRWLTGGGQRCPTNQLIVVSGRPVWHEAWRTVGLFFLSGRLPFGCSQRRVVRSLPGLGSRVCASEDASRAHSLAGPESWGWAQGHHTKGIIMSKRTTVKLILGALLLVSGVGSTACSSLGNSTSEYRNQHTRRPHRFNRPPRERRSMASQRTSADTHAVMHTDGWDM